MKFMKKEAKELREEIENIINRDNLFGFYKDPKPVKVIVEAYENWYCKDGSVARKDIANREKFLVDSVFKALGIDDQYVFDLTMRKINSREEKTVIIIEVI